MLDAPLARQTPGRLARSVPALPAQWQQAGKALALGAVALAAELGAAWLQQRQAQRPAPLARVPRRTGRSFIARQRVWETFESGRLTRRVVEQTIWNLEQEEGDT